MSSPYRKRQRIAALVVCFLFVLVLAAACHKEKPQQYKKTVEGVHFILDCPTGPLTKGRNDVVLRITDEAGSTLKESFVQVRFYTPPQSGKQSFEVLSAPGLKENAYPFEVVFPAPGQWNAEIAIRSPELKTSPLVMATFKVEVTD